MVKFDNKEFSADVYVIYSIICETHCLIENINFLINEISEDNYKKLIEKYPIIDRIEKTFSIKIILELNKLFYSREQYSLQRLIQKMIDYYNEIPWISKIEINELKLLLNDVNGEIAQGILQKVKNFRDKFYAHLDKNSEKIRLSITETKQLLEIAEIVFAKIYSAYRHKITEWKFDDSEISNHMFKDLQKGIN